MGKKISIIDYWGYVPAKIVKKGMNILDKQMQKNDNKIDEIDDETERNKDKINELAQRTDKESQKQWKSEYKKNINTVKRLKKSNDILDGIRAAGEKIIYKPVNQLIAKRIRTEKEIANLQNAKKQIEDRQEAIKQEILKTNRIEVKDDLKKELVGLKNELNKITKQISKLSAKLSRILQKIDKMKDIIDDEFDMEEEYKAQTEEQKQEKENLKKEEAETNSIKDNTERKVVKVHPIKDNTGKEEAETNSRKENTGRKVVKVHPIKDDTGREATEINPIKDNIGKEVVKTNSGTENTDEVEQNKKENIFQKNKTVSKNIVTKVSGAIRYVGNSMKNVWNKIASKVNLILSNMNNAMLESAKKSEQKLEKNIQTFEEKRSRLLNDLNPGVEVKTPDKAKMGTEEPIATVDKSEERVD